MVLHYILRVSFRNIKTFNFVTHFNSFNLNLLYPYLSFSKFNFSVRTPDLQENYILYSRYFLTGCSYNITSNNSLDSSMLLLSTNWTFSQLTVWSHPKKKKLKIETLIISEKLFTLFSYFYCSFILYTMLLKFITSSFLF